MKKSMALLVTLLLFAGVLLGCSVQNQTPTASSEQPAVSSEQPVASETKESAAPAEKKYVFGMDAQFLQHEFYQRCILGMQNKCKEIGAELIVADGNGDPNEQLNIAQQFISKKVDCIILSPADPKACKAITDAANKANIPVITESDRVEGAKTLVGADTYSAGVMIGEWIGNYLKDNNIEGKILVVGLPGLPNIANLQKGYKDGLNKSGAKFEIKAEVDGQGMKEQSLAVATDALTANPDINVILGINDDSVLGGIQAYKTMGRDTSKLITGTFGLEGNAGAKAMMEEGTLTMAMAYMPEYYGFKMVEAALKAAKGEELPDFYPSPVRIVTKENFNEFYTKNGDNYELNIAAVAALDK